VKFEVIWAYLSVLTTVFTVYRRRILNRTRLRLAYISIDRGISRPQAPQDSCKANSVDFELSFFCRSCGQLRGTVDSGGMMWNANSGGRPTRVDANSGGCCCRVDASNQCTKEAACL
jgi:hypothetical protein